jgi:PAS domain S-box-containing protein
MSEVRTNDVADILAEIGPEPVLARSDGPSDSQTRWRHRTLAVIASFALLAAACAIAGILAWRDLEATDAAVDARQARRAGTLALVAMLTAESDQRGYLLTRDPAYLSNYDEAKAEFSGSLEELRARTANRPARAEKTGTLGRIGVEKFAELDRTIAAGKSGRFDDALAIALTGNGKSLMDALTRIVGELTDEANDEVTRTGATENQLSIMLIGAIIVALLCVSGLAVLLLSDARRQFGLLETRETGARQLAASLEQRVASRTTELAAANQRFDAALRASGVTVMTQDRDLVFTWISRGVFGQDPGDVIGKSQQDVIPESALGAAANLKRGVIQSGQPARADVRIVHDGNETWYDLTVHPLTDQYGTVSGIIAGAVEITRYKEQEARIRLLMRELTHRSKNLLTVIQAIMRQTAANSTTIEDFETRFSARLQSLAGSHDLLVQEEWQGASMRDLVRSQLGHYGDRVDSQIELAGGPMQIRPDAAQHIGMALHELATNAAKYGALSTPAGKVRVSWHTSAAPGGAPLCHLSWEESGGPPVERPARRGFGRVVIERTVARALSGEVRIDYAPSGLRWTLQFPQSPAAPA